MKLYNGRTDEDREIRGRPGQSQRGRVTAYKHNPWISSPHSPSSLPALHHPPLFTMSISIDDLVSSFSASHVSQEAMDIATLQVTFPSPFSTYGCSYVAKLASVPARKCNLLSLTKPGWCPLRQPSQ